MVDCKQSKMVVSSKPPALGRMVGEPPGQGGKTRAVQRAGRDSH